MVRSRSWKSMVKSADPDFDARVPVYRFPGHTYFDPKTPASSRTYGAELISGWDFSDWVSDNPVGWSIVGGAESGTNFINQSNGIDRAHVYSEAGASIYMRQQMLTEGKTYSVWVEIVSITGSIYFIDAVTPWKTITILTTPGMHQFEFTAGAGGYVYVGASTGGAADAIINSIRVKEIL